MKKGDKILVTFSLRLDKKIYTEIGEVIEVDRPKKNYAPTLPYKVRLEDGITLWCNGVPLTDLMKELC